MSSFLAWIVAHALLAQAPLAPSPPAPVIAIVLPEQMDASMTYALNRFRGEAAAVSFSVVVVETSGLPDSEAQMEATRKSVSAVASVRFVSSGNPMGLDVWFTDHVKGKTFVERVSVEAGTADPMRVLAVKAVDVLRARMFGFLAGESGKPKVAPAPPAPAPRAPEAASAYADGSGVGLSLGVAALHNVGTALLPVMRGTYALWPWLSLRGTLGGFGTETELSAPAGTAHVSQRFGLLELAYTPGKRQLRPVLAISAGAHHMSVEGKVRAPYAARPVRRLFGAAGLSLGARGILTRHVSTTLEAGPLFLFPQPEVSLAGSGGERGGRPALIATLTLEARL
ncbi:MAG TPA: hypothetical protein VER33_15120 [Polyangiaceae bacterium]|nr:hypothetical protein [Polyangiaceae bacterium]